MVEKLIKNVEDKWLEVLYKNCEKQFSGIHLPSHDYIHHKRVWEYAKILVKIFNKHNITLNETELERLIIAIFFHDQGMSETISKDHGKISRHLCKVYFETGKITKPSHFDSILDAIEKHDRKDYTDATTSSQISIQKILNIADDLDAFNITGAYRYIEIYLLRGIAIHELSEAITENLHTRFQHFSETFHFDDSFIKSHHQRYMSARNFFKDLNLQQKQVEYKPDLYMGPIGVVNYIKNEIIGNKLAVNKACNKILNAKPDFYMQHFFEKLLKENTLK